MLPIRLMSKEESQDTILGPQLLVYYNHRVDSTIACGGIPGLGFRV